MLGQEIAGNNTQTALDTVTMNGALGGLFGQNKTHPLTVIGLAKVGQYKIRGMPGRTSVTDGLKLRWLVERDERAKAQ